MSNLSPELETLLHSHIKKFQLDRAADCIIERAVECYVVIADRADDYSAVGNTRFGGEPDLPYGCDWPRSGDPDDPTTLYSNFICQINFAELPPLPNGTPLPTSGLLSIFINFLVGCGAPVRLDTRYFDGSPSDLHRVHLPDARRLQIDDIPPLKPQRIRTRPSVSLPYYSREFRETVRSLGDPDDQLFYLYHEMEYFFRRDFREFIGQLLGFAAATNPAPHSLYRRLYFGRIGRRNLEDGDRWDSWEDFEAHLEGLRQKEDWDGLKDIEKNREEIAWLLNHREEVARSVDEWRLLCKVESNFAMDVNFCDADPLYTFVRDEDLAARNFSDMAGEVTQGGY